MTSEQQCHTHYKQFIHEVEMRLVFSIDFNLIFLGLICILAPLPIQGKSLFLCFFTYSVFFFVAKLDVVMTKIFVFCLSDV